MICFPNIKINLGLEILRKRSDRYHDIESVFYPVPFKEALEIVSNNKNEVLFQSSGLAIPGNSESNLCVKAWKLMHQEFGIGGVTCHLHKTIPMGAGLGGGSSDGAFMINLLNEHFSLNLSIEKRKQLAAQLGSDCPFFIENKTAFVEGRGEKMDTNLSLNLTGYYLTLINPGIHVSTAEAYSGVIPKERNIAMKKRICSTPIREWQSFLVNRFEESVFPKYPEIEKWKTFFYQQGALYASMTGSGSTVYGIFDKEPKLVFPEELFSWVGQLK